MQKQLSGIYHTVLSGKKQRPLDYLAHTCPALSTIKTHLSINTLCVCEGIPYNQAGNKQSITIFTASGNITHSRQQQLFGKYRRLPEPIAACLPVWCVCCAPVLHHHRLENSCTIRQTTASSVQCLAVVLWISSRGLQGKEELIMYPNSWGRSGGGGGWPNQWCQETPEYSQMNACSSYYSDYGAWSYPQYWVCGDPLENTHLHSTR